MKKLKVILYLIATIILLTSITWLTKFIVQQSTYLILPNLTSEKPSWIGFFGNIFGSIVGGLIGGFFAYLISKNQIEAQKSLMFQEIENQKMLTLEQNKNNLRHNFEIETAKIIQEPIILIQKSLRDTYSHMEKIVIFTVRYDDKCKKSSNEQYAHEIENYFKRNVEYLSETYSELKKQQLLFDSIYMSRLLIMQNMQEYTNSVLELKSKIHDVLFKMLLYVGCAQDSIYTKTPLEDHIADEFLEIYNNSFIPICSQLNKALNDLSIKIPNEFLSDLFGNSKVQPIKNTINIYKPLDKNQII